MKWEARLAKRRVGDRARRAAESEEREEARLEQLRSYQARQIAAERRHAYSSYVSIKIKQLLLNLPKREKFACSRYGPTTKA